MKQFDQIIMGACYYPEHWDESLWEDDIHRMLSVGIRMIRIGEFAWNKFEVREGVFDFSFFDRFLDLVEETEMKVIFCTPTATPPAWLTEKYPEVLCVDYHGEQHKHGMRRQYNYNSVIYQEKTRRIVEEMAKHYCGRSSIIGWQIDNELNCVTDEFYSESDHKAFRAYLQNKYKTLEAVNEAWGTVFWNQTYMDWNEIFLPRYTPRKTANPHLRLDAVRFFSESANAYCKLQADILRTYLPEDVFITTNGIFKHIDYKKMVRESLDLLSYDSYPTFGLMDSGNSFGDRKWSMNLARVRASSPVFGIMEQQSGPGGWVNYHKAPSPKPGQLRLWSFQSIAHGADFVSYFRWRTCTFGTELYWYGILGHDNRDNRRLKEVAQTAADVGRIKELAGSRYKAKAAVLYDYDNEWDAEYDVWWGPLNSYSQTGWFQGLQNAHVPFDYVTIDEHTQVKDLRRYPLLVIPHMAIIKEHVLDVVKEYVKLGGTLISGARTAYKDCFGRCPIEPEPVGMSGLFGIEIEDFTLLKEPEEPAYGNWGNTKIEMNLFHDILKPVSESCEVKAVYENDYYKGKPAVTENHYGDGRAIYFGSAFSRKCVEDILKYLGMYEPYGSQLNIPETCELAVREMDKTEYIFILNYSDREEIIDVKTPYFDLITQSQKEGEVRLNAYDILVLKEGKEER